jgi:hypothetical protein
MNTISTSPEVVWQGCQADQIVLNLLVSGKYIKANTHLQRVIVAELCKLLCRFFPHTQAILVETLMHGLSGTRVLKVQPFYAERGAGRQVVVKFGDIHAIAQEYDNYIQHVQHFIGDGRSTIIYDQQQTDHLGGILYSLLGTDFQYTQEFGLFYQQADVSQVKQTLDVLFRHTCGIWYANHQQLQPLNLTDEYQKRFGYTLKQLEQRANSLVKSVLFQEVLTFTSLQNASSRRFVNPFYLLKGMQPFVYLTYVSTTHGDLNQRNILVDQAGSPWLIDFQRTGPGHILRDVAMLDTALRFQLLSPQQATLDECLTMEETLSQIKQFDQLEHVQPRSLTKNPAVAKTYETVIHMRKLAHWLTEKKPGNDMKEYSVALLYTTLNTVRFSSLKLEQREHALLSASLLADSLRED